jgi:DNA-directed RNA polymerase specialized sigma54-like protein
VGARDVAECLALQLRERGRLDPAIHMLLKHLDLVARRDIAMLCNVCGVDAEDVADMIAEIRTLTAKPGRTFGSEPAQPIVSDVFVRKGADGTWQGGAQFGHSPAFAGQFPLPWSLPRSELWSQPFRTQREAPMDA